jgi:myo-inositol-1(or 4)-monophosphatase
MYDYPIDLFRQALDVSHEAGDLLLAHFHQQLTMSSKEDGERPSNFATDADLAAERLILARLRALRPNDVYIAEESASQRLSAPAYAPGTLIWYIDPLDGTTNFSRGLEAFCVSIAAVDASSNQTVLAVVAAPALARTWAAFDGQAYVYDAYGDESPLQRETHTTARVLNIGFPYDRAEQQVMAALVPRLLEIYPDIRAVGCAALHLCFLAEGRIDAEFQLSVHTWDYMAGKYIAECVGIHAIAPYNPRTGTYSILGAATAESLQQLRQLLPGTA